MKDPNDSFEQRLRQQLDRSVETLDEARSRQLRQARLTALEQAPARHSHHWGGLALAASVGALAVGLWLQQQPEPSDPFLIQVEAIELLAAQEDMEFYENLDFYLWLTSQEEQG